jgi:hypothetical protein
MSGERNVNQRLFPQSQSSVYIWAGEFRMIAAMILGLVYTEDVRQTD